MILTELTLNLSGKKVAPSTPRARYLPPPPNQRLSGMAQLTGGKWEAGLFDRALLMDRSRGARSREMIFGAIWDIL